MLSHNLVWLALAAFSGVQAVAIPDVDVQTTSPAEDFETSLALPPCPENGVAKRDLEVRQVNPAGLKTVVFDKQPTGTIPPKCGQKDWNCHFLQPGVSFSRGPPANELWKLVDGSQIMIWHYWQSTILFVTVGGSVTTYNAHGTIYTCAKGASHVRFTGAKPEDLVGGNGKFQCTCHQALSDDLTIFPRQMR